MQELRTRWQNANRQVALDSFTFQLDPTQASATSALTLAGTGALTPPASLTNGNWSLDFDVTVSAFGVSSGDYAATLQVFGKLAIGPGNNAATAAAAEYLVGASGITMSGSSVNPDLASWAELWAAWGSAVSGDSIQCCDYKVYGIN